MNLELIELYPSPWSERVRWVLEYKGLEYQRRNYQPLADEAKLRERAGIATVPVLFAAGNLIGDSDAAVDWIEAQQPSPALLPTDPGERAQVRAFELAATEALGPFARLVLIGRLKAMGVQPIGDHFATKYSWSPEAENRAERVLRVLLADLALAVTVRDYLVGTNLTRADVTVASLLIAALGHPPEDLFKVAPAIRSMFGLPLGGDPAYTPLHRWRENLYRRHRGQRVVAA